MVPDPARPMSFVYDPDPDITFGAVGIKFHHCPAVWLVADHFPAGIVHSLTEILGYGMFVAAVYRTSEIAHILRNRGLLTDTEVFHGA